jgi:thiamine-phosphate pyrophosphorylase
MSATAGGRQVPDLSLYLVADAALCGGRGVEAVVREAVEGGVTLVQVRAKSVPDPDLAALATRLIAILAPTGIGLIVNDRPEVAVAVGAAGVHVGQEDAPADRVRAIIGDRMILGLSIETEAQLARVDPALVDYVGIGPVRPTATKPDAAPAIGFDGLARLVAASPVPAVAIGGIGPEEAGRAIGAGAAGIAVVSAICAATDPRAAAQGLARAVASARGMTGKGKGP